MNTQLNPIPVSAQIATDGLYEVALPSLGSSQVLFRIAGAWYSLSGAALPLEMCAALGDAYRITVVTPDSRFKNITTIIGAICGAVGLPLMQAAPTKEIYWIAFSLNSIAFLFLGGRAFAPKK